MPKLDLNTKAIGEKFNEELERATKFQKAFLGVQSLSAEEQFNPIRYATHILKEGAFEERRELLGMMGTQLVLKNKVLSLKPV